MVDESSLGFDANRFDLELNRRHVAPSGEALASELREPTPVRVWAIARAFEEGMRRSDFRWFLMIFDDFLMVFGWF